ncbi:MAG: hypothetical protein PHX51_00465 [Clostridia bacterium]|nr:hypothetical protein [Clostridia bacterium]
MDIERIPQEYALDFLYGVFGSKLFYAACIVVSVLVAVSAAGIVGAPIVFGVITAIFGVICIGFWMLYGCAAGRSRIASAVGYMKNVLLIVMILVVVLLVGSPIAAIIIETNSNAQNSIGSAIVFVLLTVVAAGTLVFVVYCLWAIIGFFVSGMKLFKDVGKIAEGVRVLVKPRKFFHVCCYYLITALYVVLCVLIVGAVQGGRDDWKLLLCALIGIAIVLLLMAALVMCIVFLFKFKSAYVKMLSKYDAEIAEEENNEASDDGVCLGIDLQ